ncbi:MAG TPA: glucose-6-phosphate isomerase [Bacteroidales bacterium]|nr:glucose-6-phosphate isomerase [Bacteroidales bacterium]
MKIDIDFTNCLGFVTMKEIRDKAERSIHHLDAIINRTGTGNDFLGWLSLPEESQGLIDNINKTAESLRSQAGITVIIGIGGSYLGARAVIESLSYTASFFSNKVKHEVIFAGQNISEDYHSALLAYIDSKPFNIIVISKSGTTTEPAIAFRLLKKKLEDNVATGNINKHIIAITDSEKGALRTMADSEGYESYLIPDDVGGRYSVLTPVGLLPIAVAGFNISDFIKGASYMASITRDNRNAESNPALLYASARNLFYTKGKLIEMLVNYEPSMHYVAEWWKQLYGESEGKEGKGIFPCAADLTTDLHSLGQYIQEGERILFETVLSVKSPGTELTIPDDEENLDKLNYIAGKRLSEVNARAEEGTIMAHVEGGVPVIKINIPEINETLLGQLLYFFEIACAISGYILGVNPFDQPGVEAYKRNMFSLLGK